MRPHGIALQMLFPIFCTCDPRAFDVSKGPLRSEKKRRNRTDFYGFDPAADADARIDGRGGKTPSKGLTEFRAGSRQLFPGGL
jgi:hypothetical protein